MPGTLPGLKSIRSPMFWDFPLRQLMCVELWLIDCFQISMVSISTMSEFTTPPSQKPWLLWVQAVVVMPLWLPDDPSIIARTSIERGGLRVKFVSIRPTE